MIALTALAVAMALMLGELWVSIRHERALLARGAITPPDPVYHAMRWAYPAVFVAMALEGAGWASWGPASAGPATATSGFVRPTFVLIGVGVFIAAKLLKFWAIATLGERWTYKVLVLPGIPLVASGPYRLMRHPNYVGVVGELIGMALVTGARVTGPAGLIFFSWLLMRRIRAEEQALR